LKTRVLIVDDEPIARRGIRRYLAEHDGIEVVGEATNGINAVEQINELHPDIVFLDVQMPDLDGFGVIENVEPVNGPAPIYIFVTAHDVHAIRAFEVHAVDYLLKPYDKERFAKALVHARQVLEQRREANRGLEPLLRSLRSLRPLERFVVKDKKRIFFVPFPTCCGSKPRETMPAYTLPATVTCCVKPWRTWRKSWRHTTLSACGSQPL
jgi:two-component system, LytTR family, response regulator